MKKVIVIGGGPAGMMAAITAAENGSKVIILEKMDTCGKKLLITGKGRCNITNSAEMEEFFKNIPGNPKFLYSAFNNFTNKDIIDFLNGEGVKTKTERGGRIFPISDNAKDVLNAFLKRIKELGIEIRNNCEVTDILVEEETVKGVKTKRGETILAEKVILATGGASYKILGATGDGYKIAQKLGHTIIEIKPSLVPLVCEDEESLNVCSKAQGLSLKNIGIKMVCENKVIYEDFGEMLFTHFGVSGPVILSASSILLRYKNIEDLLKTGKIRLKIDLKPALDEEKLYIRVIRDFEEFKNKQYKNSLEKLLPKKLIDPFIEVSKIFPEKRVNEITKEERKNIVNKLKNFELIISGFGKIEEAIITAGGISTKEINPKTMESKKIHGLFFAGEVIDVDALTGGFNLQIAYSTGYTAGLEGEK